ncbi:MAG: hypothetical protein WC834_00105 [Eubacteriales bacterium]
MANTIDTPQWVKDAYGGSGGITAGNPVSGGGSPSSSGSSGYSGGSSSGGGSSGGSGGQTYTTMPVVPEWQKTLDRLKNDPVALRAEIDRTAGVLATKPTAEAGDWMSRLSGIARQVNQSGPSIANYGGAPGPTGNLYTTMPINQFNPIQQNQPAQQNQQNQQNQSGYAFQQFLADLMAKMPTYTPPTETELFNQARNSIDLQLSPTLSAIKNKLARAGTTYENQKLATEAAYSGTQQQTQARLDEIRRASLNNAISRNMGRTGLVEYNTAQMSAPILAEEQRINNEKSAKLIGYSNDLANIQNELNSFLADTEGSRGKMEQEYIDKLKETIKQLTLQQNQFTWGQGVDMAKLGIGYQDSLNNQTDKYLYG